MSQEQFAWEKEREEQKLKRWRWETARKISLEYIRTYGGGDGMFHEVVVENALALTDKLISALQRSQS